MLKTYSCDMNICVYKKIVYIYIFKTNICDIYIYIYIYLCILENSMLETYMGDV